MSAVYTLEQILGGEYELSPDCRTFCEALGAHGEVLAVQLSYLPEALLWLVTSPVQARMMRAFRAATLIMTLGEARDLLVALGDPSPANLMEVAGRFATAAPGTTEWQRDDGDDYV